MDIMTSNSDFEFLLDSGTEFRGQKIWGTPWVPKCGVWGFMYSSEEDARSKFSMIPDDTDILLSHSPPFGKRDIASKKKYVFNDKTCATELKRVPVHCGCPVLAEEVSRIRPTVHFFGHIHESSGWIFDDQTGVLNVNTSICDPLYSPDNKPIIVNNYY